MLAASSTPLDFIEFHRSSKKNELFAISILLLFLVLIRYQAILNIQTLFLGGTQADAGLYVWLLRFHTIDQLNSWFNTSAFYPYGNSLAWSDNFILPGLFGAGLIKLGIPLVVAYNLLILGANFLNGYLTYRLAFRISGLIIPALVAGTAFMCSSFFTGNLGHPQLQFAFWLPLGISLFLRAIATRGMRWTFFSALVVVATFLSTLYYAVFLALILCTLFVGVMLLRPERFNIKESACLLGASLLGLALLAPFVPAYLDSQRYFGGRQLYEAAAFSATFLSYFSAPPFHWYLSVTELFSHSEAHLFPGIFLILAFCLGFRRLLESKKLRVSGYTFCALFFLTLLLTLTTTNRWGWYFEAAHYLAAASSWLTLGIFLYHINLLGRLEKRLGLFIISGRGMFAIFSLVALLFLLISFGPLGNPEKHQAALGVHRFFFEFFPGLGSIRAISRAGMVVILFLALLSALSLAFLQKILSLREIAFAPLLILVLVENYCTTYPLEPQSVSPPLFNAISALPSKDAILTLPFSAELNAQGEVQSWFQLARRQVDAMNWSLNTTHPTVNGYSGQRSWIINNFPKLMAGFPDRTSLNALGTVAGLRYVVFAPRFVENFNAEEFRHKLDGLAQQLELLGEDNEGNFLLEYKGEIKLSPKFYLLAPTQQDKSSNLVFSLMSPYEKADREITISLQLEDSASELSNIKIKTDGVWNQYQVELPIRKSRVAPLKLRLLVSSSQSESDNVVFIKQTRVVH